MPFGAVGYIIGGLEGLDPEGDADDADHHPPAGNVLWVVLVEWWLALGHVIFGLVLCLTIIGIPMGITRQDTGMALWPPW